MNRIIAAVASHFIKPSIIFESKPPFSDNTKAVFDELVNRGYGKRYRLFWVTHNGFAEVKNDVITYWNKGERKTLKEKIRSYSLDFQTKCIICCNTFLGSSGRHQITSGKNQLSFYLSHGTPIKRVKEYYTSPGGIDYMISAAPELNVLMAEEFSIPVENTVALGFPRNDVFSKPAKDLKKLLGKTYNKIIIWYPTYRQNLDHSINLAGNSLPLIHEENNANQINEVARRDNVLIVVKPHFAQDVTQIQKLELSNIFFIDDNFFVEHNITSYEMLASSDALITDYSSVYYDYTLRDRPIAVIWEDIDEYKKDPGFAVDLDDYLKGAEKVYNIEDLCEFVKAVANDEDCLQTDRREIRDRVNISTDGQNTNRVVDFIIDKAKLWY